MNKVSHSNEQNLENLRKQVKDLEIRVAQLEDQKESAISFRASQSQESGSTKDQSEISGLADGL